MGQSTSPQKWQKKKVNVNIKIKHMPRESDIVSS